MESGGLNPRLLHDSAEISDLQILWEDSEHALCRGRRPERDSSLGSVLIVLPTTEQPTPAVLDRLAHEYDLKDELDPAWAVRPLGLLRREGRIFLLLDDPGGEPLEKLIGEPMEVGTFLGFAIDAAAALSKAHSRGLVHKDIKPANIFVNCTGAPVRLSGFGLASRLPLERRAPEPLEFIAGTLAYMAPEQTGRMNRSVDLRSDLYALGVTFYRMLTGVLAVQCCRPDGVGALSYRARTCRPGRKVRERARSDLQHRHEAPRQDGRAALPDGCGPRARSQALLEPMGREKAHRVFFGRRTRYVGAAVDSREALRARARGREVTRGVRPRCRGQWAGTGSGRRPGRHWEVFGGRRTASRTRAVAWSFRVRQVRPTQARCPLRQCSASATGADQTAVRKKRRRVGALASCTQHGARSKRCPDGDARPGARAPHRCATADSGTPAERRAAAVSLRTTSSARRIRATRTSTGTVPGRPAMARCSYARPARGSAD